jgi:hypothetical protein
VRRAIAAIEAATANTGPSPVNFGPMTITSAGQPSPAPLASLPSLVRQTTAISPISFPDATPTAPEGIEAVQNPDGLVTPLLTLGGPTGLQQMTTLQPMGGLQPLTTLQPMGGLQPLTVLPSNVQPSNMQPLNGLQTLDGTGFAPPPATLGDGVTDTSGDPLSNTQAPAISTERRGALRRLIDGIRRR